MIFSNDDVKYIISLYNYNDEVIDKYYEKIDENIEIKINQNIFNPVERGYIIHNDYGNYDYETMFDVVLNSYGIETNKYINDNYNIYKIIMENDVVSLYQLALLKTLSTIWLYSIKDKKFIVKEYSIKKFKQHLKDRLPFKVLIDDILISANLNGNHYELKNLTDFLTSCDSNHIKYVQLMKYT